MGRGDRRKCECCLKLFRPDPRNCRHQRYCSAPACRVASKTASQARWLAKPENQSHSRGADWRIAVPALRYKMSRWRNPGACVGTVLRYWRYYDRFAASRLPSNPYGRSRSRLWQPWDRLLVLPGDA
jgi:hypothetical protein